MTENAQLIKRLSRSISWILIMSSAMHIPTHAEQPLPNEAEYTRKANEYFLENQKRQAERQANKSEQQLKQERAAATAIAEAIGAANTRDISLYGRVIDQDGNPIENAWVRFAGGSDFYARSNGTFEVYTDADGRFSTAGAGGSGVLIDNIRKSGFQWPERLNGGIYFENYQRHSDSKVWDQYTEDNPYIFKLVKTAAEGQVVYHKVSLGLGGVGRAGRIYPDMRLIDFKCKDGMRCKFDAQSEEQADIRFTGGREGDAWWLRIEAVNGGIKVADPQQLYVAPADGYRQKIELSGDSGPDGYPRIFNGNVHFYSHAKRSFGLLQLEVDPYSRSRSSDGGYMFSIDTEIRINLEGNRNLATKANGWYY